MTFIEDQTLPAKKIRRDLEYEFVPKLISDLGDLACDMAKRGLLGGNSVATRGVYLITNKFSDDVTKKATEYFIEHRDASDTPAKYEAFMNSVIEHISLVLSTKFSRPPFDKWDSPLESIKQKMLKRVITESDIFFSLPKLKVTFFQRIKNIVKFLWNDPVWSKVISYGIIAFLGSLLGFLYLYSNSFFLLVQEK